MIARTPSRWLALVAAVTVTAAGLAKPEIPAGWFVWPMVEPANGTVLDASALNAAPAGAAGRITVQDGRFVDGAGKPVRFWGVNITAEGAFPSETDAELLARRLAKAGINIVRLHHLDNAWGAGRGGSLWPKRSGPHRELDPVQLDKLHRLIAILARHGIYSNLNLKVSKTLVAADGFPPSVEQLPDFQKRVDFYDRRMIELQQDYARRLLTTKNPYTGFAPADDPAVAVIEINNENSLLGYFTRDLGHGTERFPEPFREELRMKWNAWLAARYANDAALAAAWNDPDTAAPHAILDPATAQWSAKIIPGSAATVTAGADGSGFAVDVTKTDGADWHVQVSTHGLRVEDNTVYTIAGEIRASAPAKVGVGLANDARARPGEPWRSFGLLQTVDVGTDWTPVRIAFPAHSVAGEPAMLSFNVAAQTGRLEFRHLRLVAGAAGGGLRPGQSLEAEAVPLPGEPTTRQWADWIAFLESTERAFAEEMRAYLRDELHVRAPMVCSQINFSGLPALDREQSMDFTDAHGYWQHPNFQGGWNPIHWTIANSPMVSVLGPRQFGELGAIAFDRVAGKPYTVSEYDHPAPSEYVCEMYPEMAIVGSRQDWDILYAFDLGDYGSRNPAGRISAYFDQVNHPAKWSLAPWATRVFRAGLIAPAGEVAELRPGTPVWGEAMQFDMLWAKLNPDQPFDFLDCRLQVNDRPTAAKATLVRRGERDGATPARLVDAPQGKVLVAAGPQVAVATGFLGGATIDAGALHVTCPRFGRDFATVAAVALDDRPLVAARRALVTMVARAENQDMKWNAAHNSVGARWGHGPTIAERVPATIALATDGPRAVFALHPDGRHGRRVDASYADGRLTFVVSPEDRTLHYEVAAE